MNYETAIQGSDIKKKYRGFTLKLPEFEIPKGFSTALIGENGAGKTTLLNILSGIRLDYSGEVHYFDEKDTLNNPSVKERIGYTGPGCYFLPHWTGKQVSEVSELLFSGFHKDRYDAICDELGIEIGLKKVSDLSDGNRMKLMLAAVLARDTDMLILDEPASPLDPLMRDKLCELIRNYLDHGNGEKTVFFSTHNISDMENVTDYAIIMEHGRIVEKGFVEDLKEKYIMVKGEAADAKKAKDILFSFSANKYGFEGLCLSEHLDKLAGMDISTETPTLFQITVAVMKANTHLKFA